MGDEIIAESSVMAPVAATFMRELPEVKASTRILKTAENAKVIYKNKIYRKGKSAMVDATFFDIFKVKILKGNKKTVLNKPNSVVLTNSQALAYFGNADPIDKTIEIKDQGVYGQNGYIDLSGFYTVTGIIEEFPTNAHFHFDILSSMESNTDAFSQSWLNGNYHTYLKLAEGIKLSQLDTKMQAIAEKYMSPQIQSAFGMNYKEF
jgi:putative ABC transport system permease protein